MVTMLSHLDTRIGEWVGMFWSRVAALGQARACQGTDVPLPAMLRHSTDRGPGALPIVLGLT